MEEQRCSLGEDVARVLELQATSTSGSAAVLSDFLGLGFWYLITPCLLLLTLLLLLHSLHAINE